MMLALRLVLPTLALSLLAAHFFRAGLWPLAAASAGLIALVFVRNAAAARVLRVALALGALEWLRTAWTLAEHRAATGQPYLRLIVILGSVCALTALSAWIAGRRDAAAGGRTSV